MLSIIDILELNLPVYLLIFARISGAIVVVPIFGSRNLIAGVKVALSLVLTAIVGLTMQVSPTIIPGNMVQYIMMICGEIIIGLTFGFITILFFSAVQIAGQMIGMQMGFGIVNVLDPQLNTNISIIASFQFLLATLIFLAIDGHLRIIQTLVMSYEILPMLGLQSIQPAGWAIMRIASWMFLVALQLGSPIILALFLSDLTFGIIAQTVPQMNIFIVGFPIKIMIGFTFLISTIYLFGEFMGSLFEQMFFSMENILRLMS